jgi:hypothetical protein
MPKLAYVRRICSMHKIISLSLYLGYGSLFIGKEVDSNLN